MTTIPLIFLHETIVSKRAAKSKVKWGQFAFVVPRSVNVFLRCALSVGLFHLEYSSSSSLSRNSKKGNKKGSNKGPTPSPAFVITNSPTSQFSFAVTISPYALYYKFENDARRTDEDNTPLDDTGVDHMSTSISSVDEIAQLTEITRRFLEQYARGYYSQTSIITLDDFLTTLKDGETENLPVSAVFDSVALFNPASIFYPPRSQIEQLVEDAFTESLSVQSYIKMLQEELPSQNRFSTVVEVSYGGTEYMGYS